MTALTLTPQPDTASVLLQITGAPAGAVAITRVDANGSRPVRLRSGQTPIAGSLTISDYEAALTGSIRYDVDDSGGSTTSASTAMTGVGLPQVHVPVLPQYSAEVTSVTGYDAARASSTTRHQVIGRPDPVTVLGVLRTREGRLRMWCLTYDDARNLEAVAAVGEVLMLRQTDYPGMDMYFIADASRITPDQQATINGQRWAVEWDYAEVAVPTSALLGSAGWSFNNVAALARFRDVKQTYATFAALAVG